MEKSATKRKRTLRDPSKQMDQDEASYRQLVSIARPSLSSATGDLEVLYGHFDLPMGQALALRSVTDHLYRKIAEVLRIPANAEGRPLRLRVLEKQLVLRHIADGAPLQPELALLDVLKDATRASEYKIRPLTERKQWMSALAAAADYNLLEPSVFSDRGTLLTKRYPRQYAVATAIKRLRGLGYKVGIRRGRPVIAHDEELRIADRIELCIRKAGGIETAAAIFGWLRNRYDRTQERYHIVRRTGTTGGPRSPSFPIAYLLNLCVKNASSPGARSLREFSRSVKDGTELAKEYAATFDLEPYNTFETLFHSGFDLPRFLQEITVYDGMFDLVQRRPSVVEEMVKALFSWYDDATAECELGWTISQAALVMRAVLRLAREQPSPFLFARPNLAQRLPMLSTEVLDALLGALAHQPNAVNSRYRLPYDQTALDFGCKPLIRQPDNRYVLMNRSWCALGFYEAVLGAVRGQKGRMADVQVGYAFERFVRECLRQRGVTVSSGKYSVQGVEGECDAVVETSDRIILVEVKKKSLTRQARGGDSVSRNRSASSRSGGESDGCGLAFREERWRG